MFILATLIGVYAYALQVIGQLGFLSAKNILIQTVLFAFILAVLVLKKIPGFISINTIRINKFQIILVALIVFALGVLLIGALGPEIHFDALWYHLTLPKVYLSFGQIIALPHQAPWFYSLMPELVEMLYMAGLSLQGDIGAKVLHAVFAILTAVAIAQFTHKKFGPTAALFAALWWLSDGCVLWLSSTADVDIARAFFETLGVVALVQWSEKINKISALWIGGMVGLAASVKYLSLATAAIIGVIMIWVAIRKKLSLKDIFIHLLLYSTMAIVSGGYWYIKAYLLTGNPLYPLFTYDFIELNKQFLGPDSVFDLITDAIRLSTDLGGWDAALSPIYLAFLPLILISKKTHTTKLLLLYAGLYYLAWFFIPRSGGARFIVPLAAVMSVLSGSLLARDAKLPACIRQYVVFLSLGVVAFNILIHGYIVKKNIPVIMGMQSKQEFLDQNLNKQSIYFDKGYVSSKYASESIKLFGPGAFFYADFPFTHESFLKEFQQNNTIGISLKPLATDYPLLEQYNQSNLWIYRLATDAVVTVGLPTDQSAGQASP